MDPAIRNSYMESSIYLAQAQRPSRRKSPVFFLLLLTSVANIGVFVLGITRLGKELQGRVVDNTDLLRLISIGWTIFASICTTIFLVLTLSFFKTVYPRSSHLSSSFTALRLGEKAKSWGTSCSRWFGLQRWA